MMDTLETETKFMAESGHTSTLRVTARDHVGNAGQDEASVLAWSVVKYFGFADQLVAMRRCDVDSCRDAIYLHGDHSLVPRDRLGSTAFTTDNNRVTDNKDVGLCPVLEHTGESPTYYYWEKLHKVK